MQLAYDALEVHLSEIRSVVNRMDDTLDPFEESQVAITFTPTRSRWMGNSWCVEKTMTAYICTLNHETYVVGRYAAVKGVEGEKGGAREGSPLAGRPCKIQRTT